MTKYICSKSFQVDKYGDDGELLDEKIKVAEGSVWQVEEATYNMVVTDEGVRLVGTGDNAGYWIELYTDTLNEHFEQVADNLSDLSDEQLEELEKDIENFIVAKAYIENFIARYNLDEDEVWEKIKEDYEEAMSRQHG